MKTALLAAVSALMLTAWSGYAYAVDAVIAIPTRVSTYSATITGLVPAASATDFFTLTGSASSIVRLKRAVCSGVSTASGTDIVLGLLRSTADLTGTSTTPAPIAHDQGDGAATAVARAYTVNPGTLGTAIGTLRAGTLGTSVAASAAAAAPLEWTFGGLNDKEVVLRGATQSFALNGNAASFQAGSSLSCYFEWTESAS